MATQGVFIRDQNLNVHFDAPSGLTASKAQKNGGLGVRKALGDISNSRRPSTIHPPTKLKSKNVTPIEEDFVPVTTKSSFGGKTKVSSKISGRKALGDLTNSVVKPCGVVQELKKVKDRKLGAVVEEPFRVDFEGTDEHFLHDHGECIKAQKKAKALETDTFLKLFGVDNSMQSPPYKMKPESPIRIPEMEEVPEPWFKDSDETLCAIPISPPRFQWDEHILPSLKLKGTP